MESRPKRLLDQVRDVIRVKHYSPKTEESYVHWIKRYIFFHDKRHPMEMGEEEIETFLTHLATKERVAASTQNQAFSALLFLYRNILKKDLPHSIEAVRAKCSKHLPTVLTKTEVQKNHHKHGGHVSTHGRAQQSPINNPKSEIVFVLSIETSTLHNPIGAECVMNIENDIICSSLQGACIHVSV